MPDKMWRDVRAYAEILGMIDGKRAVNISAVLRDLLGRGLTGNSSADAAYARGYQQGRAEGYAAIMRQLAAPPPRRPT